MWLVRAVFALVLACGALAATGARADYQRSQRWFNSLSDWERRGVQTNLILGGFYAGFADGRFGRNTYNALTAFEDEFSLFSNGMLNKLEAALLVNAAREWTATYGMRDVRDDRAGIAFPVPFALVDRHRETDRGAVWTSGAFEVETFAYMAHEAPLERMYAAIIEPSVTEGLEYKFLGSDFFVVSGEKDGGQYYIYFRENAAHLTGFSVLWSKGLRSRAARLPVYILAKARFFAPTRPVPSLGDDHDEDVAIAPGTPKAYVPPSPPPDAPPAVPPGNSSGSGFFVSANGLILTNRHVVEGCSTIDVPRHGKAELLRSDGRLDLAAILVRQPPATQKTAIFEDQPVALGSAVLAGGYPLSELLNNNFTIADGKVTMRGGLSVGDRDFAISAALQPGNSGGAVVNDRGKVVGIAVAKFDDAKLIETVRTTGANFSFAIDAVNARDFLRPFTLDVRPAFVDTGAPLGDVELAASLASYSVQILCYR
jgi:serine protease Do